jgi:5-methylcytosine-specific restriction endonuclease McrA
MDEEFRKKERRRQAQLERLGTNTPRCVVCGEDDSRCLELHHLAGRKFGDELVIVCRNCHRKLSDAQKDNPKPQADAPSFEERLAHFLLGVADLFELLVIRFREFAKHLTAKLIHSRVDEEAQS